MNRIRFFLFLTFSLCMVPSAHSEVMPNDAYIAGYATGILKRDYDLDFSSMMIRDGIITLPTPNLTADDPAKIRQILSEIPGVLGV